jgi:hypothetical protein
MDIEDYKSLIDLFEDDDGVCHGKQVTNPNRLLKGLTLSHRKSRRGKAYLIIFFAIGVCLMVWAGIFYCWAVPPEDGMWLGIFTDEDREVQATLLLVGTAMVGFHITFEWLYWRETQCVMPLSADGKTPVDPRMEGTGVPRQYRWFGLPSMWFTSQQAYDDLRLWIMHCRQESDDVLPKIYPEEMALLALDPDGAPYLRKTLGSAKLFSSSTWDFMVRDAQTGKPRPVSKGEQPEELGVDFVLFDSASEQFLQPEIDYRSSMMRLLTRSFSEQTGQQFAL